jgi:hypothetical protein
MSVERPSTSNLAARPAPIRSSSGPRPAGYDFDVVADLPQARAVEGTDETQTAAASHRAHAVRPDGSGI